MTRAQVLIVEEMASSENVCVSSSFQVEGVVLIHMLRQVRAEIPVLFVDTLHHFAETCAYRDRLSELWNLNVITLRAAEPRLGYWQQDMSACCARHKVEPLFEALAGYDVWFTGLRRDQSPTRAELAEVESFTLPTNKVLRKVSPLASWTNRETMQYATMHAIPLLPLYQQGYTSIGCEPCTIVPIDPSFPRSGRWQGQKLECGIHTKSKVLPLSTTLVDPRNRSTNRE